MALPGRPSADEKCAIFPVTVSEQAVVARAEPEAALRVLVDSPNLHLGQTARHRIAQEPAVVHVAHAAVSTDPEIALAIFKQRPRAEVGKPVAHLITHQARTRALHKNVIQTLVGSHPHAPVAVLGHGANEVVRQPIPRRQVRNATFRDPVNAVAVGSHPKRAGAVAVYVAHVRRAYARQSLRSHHAIFHAGTDSVEPIQKLPSRS